MEAGSCSVSAGSAVRLARDGAWRGLDVKGAPNWPNLFIVGAAKAGTTSLSRYLNEHPDVYMSAMKEPHFFSHIEPDPRLAAFFPHVEDATAYLALFSNAGRARVRGEASTSYLTHEGVATSI